MIAIRHAFEPLRRNPEEALQSCLMTFSGRTGKEPSSQMGMRAHAWPCQFSDKTP